MKNAYTFTFKNINVKSTDPKVTFEIGELTVSGENQVSGWEIWMVYRSFPTFLKRMYGVISRSAMDAYKKAQELAG